MFWKRHSTAAANHKLAQDRRADLANSPVREVLPEVMLTVTRKDCPKTVFLASIFARVMKGYALYRASFHRAAFLLDRAAFLLERNGCLFH
jgi:hypothetical protein